jgi:hypothetical protein
MSKRLLLFVGMLLFFLSCLDQIFESHIFVEISTVARCFVLVPFIRYVRVCDYEISQKRREDNEQREAD